MKHISRAVVLPNSVNIHNSRGDVMPNQKPGTSINTTRRILRYASINAIYNPYFVIQQDGALLAYS